MISKVVDKRGAVFKPGVALAIAFSLLLFAPFCHASTISISDDSIASSSYSSFPVSDRSDGIFQPTLDVMLDLIPDAIFNFSTITIESAISVGFNRNGSDMPIYFLATGNVLIDGALDGGMGPLYIATPGSITINGDLLGQELTLSGSDIVVSSGTIITGTSIVLSSDQPTNIQSGSRLSLLPGDQLRLSGDQVRLESPGSIQFAPVPVPPSFFLLLTGLIPMWLAGMFRFRRNGRRGD